MHWRVIEYREFYDVPRMIVAADDEGLYLFYSRFDQGADEYLRHYEVYRMPELKGEVLAGSWEGLELRALERKPDIALNELPFKIERRAQ